MNQKLLYRGPDQQGIYVDQHVSLGQTRLAIIDLSENAKPPIYNEDKSMVIVYSGEIYNYQEIKKELMLKGHQFYTKTDTEVVLHAYEEYGVDCLQLFNGMFAFAIWSLKNKKLFLARDRLGIKPLYYYWYNKHLIFSSEIKAILEHSVSRQVNLESFNHYFRLGFVPQPLTMFENIYKLPAAHYLIFKDQEVAIKQYWQVNNFEDIHSEALIEEKIEFLIKDSVKRQLISDRPVGIYLSGGIDSTVIAGVVNDLAISPLNSFSVTFGLQKNKFNQDNILAQQTAKIFRTKHHSLVLSDKDVASNFEKVVYHLDEPIANTAQVAELMLAKTAKDYVTVALNGGGGDELFGGYPRYYFNQIIDRWQALPRFFPSSLVLQALSKVLKKDLKEKFQARGLDRYRQFMFRKEKDIALVVNSSMNDIFATQNFYQLKFFNQIPTQDFTKYFMFVDMSTWMVDLGLINSDKVSMAFGLEVRYPLIDHRLVELAFQIPTKYKIQGKNKKRIFKKAMARYLPAHVLHQPKRGFFAPISDWLRRDLKDLASAVFSESYCPATRDYFNFINIQRLFQEHLNKKGYHLNTLLSVMTWQIWYKTFIQK